MGQHNSYNNPDYKKRQSEITKNYWQLGRFNFKIKPKTKLTCQNSKCLKDFYVSRYELQTRKYCCISCSAQANNSARIVSGNTKLKISLALTGKHPHVPVTRFAKQITVICRNKTCHKSMRLPPHLAKRRKYCSVNCAIKDIGSRTTSPKASKGKSGVRNDIDNQIIFYSTWEANIARVYNLIGLKWHYAPKIFDLGNHTYRPDFYLPKFDTYVEVKNFMGEYSLVRDSLFRRKFPKVKLDLLLKTDYIEIKSSYQTLVEHWEY